MADATVEPNQEEHDDDNSHIFPNLPDYAALLCLARLPRSSFRSLSRVCKSWRNAFHSQTLYSTRRALKFVDFSFCLHIRVRVNREYFTNEWYEFFPGSNRTAARSLFKIPSLPSSAQPLGACVASVGGKIYVIGGGDTTGTGTGTVWAYDLISDQWKLVKSQMRVARKFAVAAVINNKIYVMSGCGGPHPNWAEVFDPETGVWSPLPNPNFDEAGWDWKDLIHSCSVLNGKIIYSARKLTEDASVVTLGFDPSSGEWSQLPSQVYLGSDLNPTAVIDGVSYRFINGKLMGYDFDVNEWKVIRGVMDGFLKSIYVAKMVNMNGRLVILWKEWCTVRRRIKMLKFHAAVIELWKDDTDAEFWGWIVWMGIVGKAPLGTRIVDCLTVGL